MAARQNAARAVKTTATIQPKKAQQKRGRWTVQPMGERKRRKTTTRRLTTPPDSGRWFVEDGQAQCGVATPACLRKIRRESMRAATTRMKAGRWRSCQSSESTEKATRSEQRHCPSRSRKPSSTGPSEEPDCMRRIGEMKRAAEEEVWSKRNTLRLTCETIRHRSARQSTVS